jgi:hypothetical protein
LLVTLALASQDEPTAEEDVAGEQLVVPPGQEQLLSAMLGHGAKLPDGCTFAGGTSADGIIESTYTCPSGKVVFAITHRSDAGETATLTEDFAISVESGAPPEELTDVVASLIRSREADLELVSANDPVARAAKGESAP